MWPQILLDSSGSCSMYGMYVVHVRPCHVTKLSFLKYPLNPSIHEKAVSPLNNATNHNQTQTLTYLHPLRSSLLSMNRQPTTFCRRVTINNHVFYRSLNLCQKRRNRPLSNTDFSFQMPSVLQECVSKVLEWISYGTEVQPYRRLGVGDQV